MTDQLSGEIVRRLVIPESWGLAVLLLRSVQPAVMLNADSFSIAD